MLTTCTQVSFTRVRDDMICDLWRVHRDYSLPLIYHLRRQPHRYSLFPGFIDTRRICIMPDTCTLSHWGHTSVTFDQLHRGSLTSSAPTSYQLPILASSGQAARAAVARAATARKAVARAVAEPGGTGGTGGALAGGAGRQWRTSGRRGRRRNRRRRGGRWRGGWRRRARWRRGWREASRLVVMPRPARACSVGAHHSPVKAQSHWPSRPG